MYNITISIKFRTQSKIYALIIKNPESAPKTLNFTKKNHTISISENSTTIFPTSKQIKNGRNYHNQKLK